MNNALNHKYSRILELNVPTAPIKKLCTNFAKAIILKK